MNEGRSRKGRPCSNEFGGTAKSLLDVLKTVSNERLKLIGDVTDREESAFERKDDDQGPQTLKRLPVKQLYKKRTLDEVEIVLLLAANTYVKEKGTVDIMKLTYYYFYALAEQSYGPSFVRFPKKRSYHNMRRRLVNLRATYAFSYDCLERLPFYPFEVFKAESSALLLRLIAKAEAAKRTEEAQCSNRASSTKRRTVEPPSVYTNLNYTMGKSINDIIGLVASGDEAAPKLRRLQNTKCHQLLDFQRSDYYLQMQKRENGFRKHYLAQFLPVLSSDVMSQSVVAVLSGSSTSPASTDVSCPPSSPLCQNLLRSLFFMVLRDRDYSKASSLLHVILQYVSPADADHSRFMMYRAYLDFCIGKMDGANDLYSRLVKNLSKADRQICISLKLDVLVQQGRYERALVLTEQFVRMSAIEDFMVWSRILNARLELSIILDDSDAFRGLLLTELSPFTLIPNEESLSLQVLVNALLWQIIKHCQSNEQLVCDLAGTLLVGLFAHETESAMWNARKTVQNLGVVVREAMIYDKLTNYGLVAYTNCKCRLAERLLQKVLKSSHVTAKSAILLKLGQMRSMNGDHKAADNFLGLALEEAEAEAGQGITFATVLLYLANSKVFQTLWDEAELLYIRAKKILKAGGYTKSKVYFELQVAHASIVFHKGSLVEVCRLLTKVRGSFMEHYGRQHNMSIMTSLSLACGFYFSGDISLSNQCFNFAKSGAIEEFFPTDPACRALSVCNSVADYLSNFVMLSEDGAAGARPGGDHPLTVVMLYPRCYNTESSFGNKTVDRSVQKLRKTPETPVKCNNRE